MKKPFLLLMLLTALSVEAVAQNNAMYVYRNDGAINAFLKTDIDSIRFSNLDIDNVQHKEYVVQEVCTADSIYRIPLAVIDSINFVTPPPSYQEGVEQVSADLYEYVISYTDSTITFKPDIPSRLLPTQGQVIVADKYEDPFATGFSGRMTGMQEYADSIVCMFEGVYLDDIYSRLLLVGSAESYHDEANPSRAQTRAIWEDHDRNIYLPASIPLKAGLVTAELERPSLRIDYFVCINEGSLQNHVMFKARFNSAGSLSLKVSKDATFGDEPHWLSSIPIKVGVVSGCIDFGYFVQASGSIEAGVTFPFEVGYSGGFLYTDSKGIVSDTPQRSFTWKEPEWKASINGSLYAGVASRLSIALLHTKVACIDLTGKFGPEVSSSFTISSAEGIHTTVYENLKEVEVTSSLKLELTPGYRVWFDERKEFGGINLSVEFLKKTVPLMPSISNLSWKRLSSTGGELNGSVQKDIFFPCKLGWAVYNNDECHSTHFLPDSYWVQDSWNNNGLQYQLSDIPPTGNCKAYPVVRLLDMLSVRVPKYVDLSSIPVHITRFDVTDSEYKPGAFLNEGLYYNYKFNVSLTVEIDHLDGVADWGYVYRDPSGNIKRISLMEYGKSYTDTRYAYYRNEAHSTACLYTYVKYVGDSEYYDSEPHDYPLDIIVFSCPNNNHPHAIDLGLPSGTKWACCNIGATTPERAGGYYAWGETSEKSIYNDETYMYCTGQDTDGDGWFDQNYDIIYIGSNIAGTPYDVAHVKWGGSWVMPSLERAEEIHKYCRKEMTKIKGVLGTLMTGPSGGQVFFPAFGYRIDGYLNTDIVVACYWTSTLDPDFPKTATSFSIGPAMWYNGGNNSLGLSVRAVCP
ncbi:MAG: hypothetical protein ACI3YX_10510 [Prevotella sp.]